MSNEPVAGAQSDLAPGAAVIRAATGDDDRALAVLDADSWPPQLWVTPPQDAALPFFTQWRQPEDVIVAEVDGHVVGYARIARHMRVVSNEHVLHFDALAVSPAARGHGIASLLIEAAVQEARRRGVRKLGLRALSTNTRALKLYDKHGFTEEGRLIAEIRLPDGSYADDVWMAIFFN